MKRLIKSKKGVALLVTLVVVAASSIGAYAYFTSTGHGTGAATGGNSTALTILGDAPGAQNLTPDGGPAEVDFTITNPGTGVERVHTVTASIDAFSVTVSGHPACTQADFSLNNAVQTIDQEINGTTLGGNTLDWNNVAGNTLSVQLNNNHLDQDSCEGVNVPLTFISN